MKRVKTKGDNRKINNYDYVKMFDDIFFDVEENDDEEKTLKSIIMMPRQLFSTIILRFCELIHELSFDDDGVFDGKQKYVRITVILLIRKIIEMLDAMTVLMEKSIYKPTDVLFRSYVETVVTLCFILKEHEDIDINLKAAAFYLQRRYEEKRLFEKTLSDIEKCTISIDMESFGEIKKVMQKKLAGFETMIEKDPYFKEINEKRGGKNKKWYEVLGFSNFRQLMEDVGMGKYYDGVYSTISIDVHGVGVSNDMDIDLNTKTGLPRLIRSPEGAENTVGLIADFSCKALKTLYLFLGDEGSVLYNDNVFFLDFLEKKTIIIDNLSKIRIDRSWAVE